MEMMSRVILCSTCLLISMSYAINLLHAVKNEATSYCSDYALGLIIFIIVIFAIASLGIPEVQRFLVNTVNALTNSHYKVKNCKDILYFIQILLSLTILKIWSI